MLLRTQSPGDSEVEPCFGLVALPGSSVPDAAREGVDELVNVWDNQDTGSCCVGRRVRGSRLHRRQQSFGLQRRQVSLGGTGDQLCQQPVQPVDGLHRQVGQLVAPVSQQPQRDQSLPAGRGLRPVGRTVKTRSSAAVVVVMLRSP